MALRVLSGRVMGVVVGKVGGGAGVVVTVGVGTLGGAVTHGLVSVSFGGTTGTTGGWTGKTGRWWGNTGHFQGGR